MKSQIHNVLKRHYPLTIGFVLLLAATSCGVLNVSISTPAQGELKVTPTPEAIVTEVFPETDEAPSPIDDQYAIPDRPLGSGPWLVFQSGDALWAVNPDASGLTQLVGGLSILPAKFANSVAPQGGNLALITSDDAAQRTNLSLEFLSLPGGRITSVSALTNPETEPGPDSSPGDPKFEAVRAITDLQSFAWSPDGQSLAFMGVIEGPTSDLYLYSLESGDITRLTDGPSQAISPTWSPDSEFILHSGVETLGTGAGFLMSGIWAARADDSSVLDLYPIPPGSGNEVVVGWIASDQFLVYSWSVICGPNSLRIYSLSDQAEEFLWNGFFSDVALDPFRGNVVLTIDEMTAQCNEGGVQGIFFFQTGQMAAFEVLEFGVYKMSWVPEIDRFLARFDTGFLAIDSEGDATTLEKAPIESAPVISADGRFWAFSGTEQMGEAGVWVGEFGQQPKNIFSESAWQISWSPDGEGIFFFAEAGLFFAPAPTFKPILVAAGLELDQQHGMAWVRP